MKLRSLRAKKVFQAETVFGCLNFLSVLPADGVHGIAEIDRALHQVDSPVKFHQVRAEESWIKTDLGQQGYGKDALVTEVVNGEEKLDSSKGGIAAIGISHIWSHQRGLPIMAVKNIRAE